MAFANTLHNTGFALDNKFIILEDPRLRDNKAENIQQIFQQDYWWPKAVSGLYRAADDVVVPDQLQSPRQ